MIRYAGLAWAGGQRRRLSVARAFDMGMRHSVARARCRRGWCGREPDHPPDRSSGRARRRRHRGRGGRCRGERDGRRGTSDQPVDNVGASDAVPSSVADVEATDSEIEALGEKARYDIVAPTCTTSTSSSAVTDLPPSLTPWTSWVSPRRSSSVSASPNGGTRTSTGPGALPLERLQMPLLFRY